MKKQKQKHGMQKMVWVVLVILVVFVVGAVVGMGLAISKVAEVAVSKTATAVLASAGVEDGTDISLTVDYWDQRQDECVNLYDNYTAALVRQRQFEWTSCGYYGNGFEQGLVSFELAGDYLPMLKSGEMISNRGVEDAERWFTTVEGKSQAYTGTLKLSYTSERAEFVYKDEEFYPLDSVNFSKGDAVNVDGRNHLFTMAMAVPFVVAADGNESFEITADDDTFVFVGEKLALDMGGIHTVMTGKFEIHEGGEIYTSIDDEDLAYAGITVGQNSVVRIFHADRDAKSSEFAVKFTGMRLSIATTELANAEGVQIAYDPNNPTYVAPLGESMTFQPDNTRAFVIMATVFGMVLVVSAVFATMMLKRLVCKK